MATVPFSATTRGTTGKGVARKLRAAGQVPAVIYGHARQPQPLALDHHALTLFLEKHPYQSTVIALNVDGTSSNTLIREVQRHPYKKQILHELELDCDPTNIPGHINVDVTALTIGHSIHAGEIALPAGVTLRSNPDATVCVCAAPRVEAEAAPAEGASTSEPELIRKAKADEEAEAK